MVPFDSEADEKHSLRQTGRKFVFNVNGLSPDDAGLYQVDVEGVNVFSTDLKSEVHLERFAAPITLGLGIEVQYFCVTVLITSECLNILWH